MIKQPSQTYILNGNGVAFLFVNHPWHIVLKLLRCSVVVRLRELSWRDLGQNVGVALLARILTELFGGSFL